jgi:hypothetical protein
LTLPRPRLRRAAAATVAGAAAASVLLQVQGYMQDDHNDSFKCGARP